MLRRRLQYKVDKYNLNFLKKDKYQRMKNFTLVACSGYFCVLYKQQQSYGDWLLLSENNCTCIFTSKSWYICSMWRHPHPHIWVSSAREGYFYICEQTAPSIFQKCHQTDSSIETVKTVIFWRSTFQRSICTRFRSGIASKVLPWLWCTTILPGWEIEAQSGDLTVLPSLWCTTLVVQ